MGKKVDRTGSRPNCNQSEEIKPKNSGKVNFNLFSQDPQKNPKNTSEKKRAGYVGIETRKEKSNISLYFNFSENLVGDKEPQIKEEGEKGNDNQLDFNQLGCGFTEFHFNFSENLVGDKEPQIKEEREEVNVEEYRQSGEEELYEEISKVGHQFRLNNDEKKEINKIIAAIPYTEFTKLAEKLRKIGLVAVNNHMEGYVKHFLFLNKSFNFLNLETNEIDMGEFNRFLGYFIHGKEVTKKEREDMMKEFNNQVDPEIEEKFNVASDVISYVTDRMRRILHKLLKYIMAGFMYYGIDLLDYAKGLGYTLLQKNLEKAIRTTLVLRRANLSWEKHRLSEEDKREYIQNRKSLMGANSGRVFKYDPYMIQKAIKDYDLVKDDISKMAFIEQWVKENGYKIPYKRFIYYLDNKKCQL